MAVSLFRPPPPLTLKTLDLMSYHASPDLQPLFVESRKHTSRGPRRWLAGDTPQKLEVRPVVGRD